MSRFLKEERKEIIQAMNGLNEIKVNEKGHAYDTLYTTYTVEPSLKSLELDEIIQISSELFGKEKDGYRGFFYRDVTRRNHELTVDFNPEMKDAAASFLNVYLKVEDGFARLEDFNIILQIHHFFDDLLHTENGAINLVSSLRWEVMSLTTDLRAHIRYMKAQHELPAPPHQFVVHETYPSHSKDWKNSIL